VNNVRVTNPDTDRVFQTLTATFRANPHSALLEIRRSGDEAVFVFRWTPDPHLYGVPVPLNRTTQRLDWDRPATDLNDWIQSVGLWLLEDVENGFAYRARRRWVDHYIELRGPDWPSDERFYFNVVGPGDADAWLRVPYFKLAGLDPKRAVEARERGALIGWVRAYENNLTGGPYVGQATISWSTPGVAVLDWVAVTSGVPDTLTLELVRFATHAACDNGAVEVMTDLDLKHLAIAGFRPASDKRMVMDTTFLSEDPEGADGVLRDALADPGWWGRDRDREGRYLPPSRFGRWVHRLRHGRSGARPRLYVGC